VGPFNQRQGFLVSAIVHLTILMMLVSRPPTIRKTEPPDPATLERKEAVFLPPQEVLRRLVPLRRREATRPTPTPPAAKPPDPRAKDRISIGPPTDVRTKGPLILRREDDLTKAPKGRPDARPTPAPPAPPAPASPPKVADGGAPQVPGREGLRVPPGLGSELTRGSEGSKARPGSLGPSINSAIENVEKRLDREARLGIPTGTGGQNLGGLFFDPQGADFTLWINHFKNEVYRNWIVPQPALMGFKGHVDFEFTVERDGSLSALRMLKSSGTPAMDRAAQNALQGSRFLALPSDYGPQRITMQVSFFYNEGPHGS
jgi:periplasmic protein TonB